MTRRLVAGMSGWGKSWATQAIAERNLDREEFPVGIVFDYKDEYRGLVEAGHAVHFIVGPKEAEWSASRWAEFLKQNPKVVLARYQLTAEEWRKVVGEVTRAARHVGQKAGGAFLVIEEAHFVAPQKGGFPESVKGLATTGRGEGAASLWSTQRLAELDETVLAQVDERMLGGFTSDADLTKIQGTVGYPKEVHNPQGTRVTRLPDELEAGEEGPIPVRKFEDEAGHTLGSEWIYSDTGGTRERRDTREWTLQSEHHGPEGHTIEDPM